MTWSEGRIARLVATQVLRKKCVVLVDRCNWTGNECDVLAVTNDLRIIDVEVKISRADLKADARKDKWWHLPTYTEAVTAGLQKPGEQWDPYAHRLPRQWPRRVWKHYYAIPSKVWTDDLFDALPSPASGVILVRDSVHPGTFEAYVKRPAKPDRAADRLTAEQVMDIARLANLRMWDAYAQRDKEKSP